MQVFKTQVTIFLFFLLLQFAFLLPFSYVTRELLLIYYFMYSYTYVYIWLWNLNDIFVTQLCFDFSLFLCYKSMIKYWIYIYILFVYSDTKKAYKRGGGKLGYIFCWPVPLCLIVMYPYYISINSFMKNISTKLHISLFICS